MISFHSNTKQFFDTVCIPFFQVKEGVSTPFSEFSDEVKAVLAIGDFKAKEGELFTLYPNLPKVKRLVLLGLGKQEELNDEKLRRAFSSVSKFCKEKKIDTVTLFVPSQFSEDEQKACLEGLLLANYAYDVNKTEKTVLIKKIGLFGASAQLKSSFEELLAIVSGVFLTRDLVTGNADEVTPDHLADLAKKIEKKFKDKLTLKILGKKEIVKEGLGLLNAVSQGASKEPKLIVLEYKGAPSSSDKTVVIGKGITYDTGGLLIKPRGGMEDMRCDMAGAATCFGTLWSALELNLKVNLSIVIAATENAIGPDAFKPGDVFKSFSGKTVEISDTDAEGRLVLADAITYTNKYLKPSRIIDLATLTGAMMISLGEEMAGMFSNDKELSDALLNSSNKTHEGLWLLPLNEDYKSQLKSDVADIRNKGDRWGGAITAALFLKEFIDKTSWAHLDIAGPAFYSKDRYYTPKNGTGYGVRLLISYLKGHCAKKKTVTKK